MEYRKIAENFLESFVQNRGPLSEKVKTFIDKLEVVFQEDAPKDLNTSLSVFMFQIGRLSLDERPLAGMFLQEIQFYLSIRSKFKNFLLYYFIYVCFLPNKAYQLPFFEWFDVVAGKLSVLISPFYVRDERHRILFFALQPLVSTNDGSRIIFNLSSEAECFISQIWMAEPSPQERQEKRRILSNIKNDLAEIALYVPVNLAQKKYLIELENYYA